MSDLDATSGGAAIDVDVDAHRDAGGDAPAVRGPLWRPLACIGISLAGIAVSIYLTYVHYSPGALACPGSGKSFVDCQKVLTSAQSVLFKIPVPFYGLAFFIAMIVLNLPAMWRSESMWIARIRLGAAVVGMGMVLYLVSQEFIVIRNLCVWCTSVHILTFALFLIIITGWEQTGWARSRWADDGD